MLLLGICACERVADAPPRIPAGDAGTIAGCGEAGSFRVRVYGEITADLDWSHGQYECRGMPRPDDRGVRLFFVGPDRDAERRLAFILAIPDFDAASAAGGEFASTLTLIEEGGGRFFSTSSNANCLTEIATVDAISTEADRFTVTGAVYCVSPLAEVNGESSVSIAELSFTGLLDWSAS